MTDKKRIDHLLFIVGSLLDYIDSIPKDVEFECMPGIDRDYIDEVVSNTHQEES